MFSTLGSLIKSTFQSRPTATPPKELYGLNGEQALHEFLNNAMGPDPTFSPLGNLTNPIHPIFAKSRFQHRVKDPAYYYSSSPISETAYLALTPALRLASLLITTPRMLEPFDHVAKGIITTDIDGDRYIARGPLEGTDLGLACVQEIFQHVSRLGLVNFVFRDPKLDGPDEKSPSLAHTCFYDQQAVATYPIFKGYAAWASDAEPADTVLVTANDGSTALKRVRKGVAMIHFPYKELRYFEREIGGDPARYQLNALLSWTHSLLHEVMHAFHRFVCPWTPGVPEARYVFESGLHELGTMYEVWLNSGRIARRFPVLMDKVKHAEMDNARSFPIAFIECLEWRINPADSTKIEVEGLGEPVILSTDVVHAWFLEKTWDRIRDEGHGFLLKQSELTSLDWWELYDQYGSFGVQLRFRHKVYKRVFCGDVRVDQPILQNFGRGWEELFVVD